MIMSAGVSLCRYSGITVTKFNEFRKQKIIKITFLVLLLSVPTVLRFSNLKPFLLSPTLVGPAAL